MAKKRVARRRILKVNKTIFGKKNIPNPFNRLSGAGSLIKNIPLTEKTLLIALLVFIGIVAFSTNSDNLTSITGAFVDVTGEQTINTGTISQSISNVFSIITEGIAEPIFNLWGTDNILIVKIFLLFVIYILLVYGAGLKDKFEGKGKIIAGILSFMVSALIPSKIIETYVGELIPGVITFFFSLIFIILVLYWLYKLKVESRFGHAIKSIIYLFFVLTINFKLGNLLTKIVDVPTIFNETVSFAIAIAIIYALIMGIVEFFRIFSGAPGAVAKGVGRIDNEEIGRIAGKVVSYPGRAKENIKKGWREGMGIAPQMAKVEELAEKMARELKAMIIKGADRNTIEAQYVRYINNAKKEAPDVKDKDIKNIWTRACRNHGIRKNIRKK